MKTSNKILLGLFAAIALNFLTSMVLIRSSLVPKGMGNGASYIQGNKDIKKVKLTAQDFSNISIGANFMVTLIQGQEEFVEIEADVNLIDYFDIKVKDKRLSLSTKKDFTLLPTEGVQVTIGFKNLREIRAHGNSTIASPNSLKVDSLNLEIHGSGDLAFGVDAQHLDLRIQGSGKGRFHGTTNQLKIAVFGSGDFRGAGFVSKNAHVNISGSGYADLNVTDHLDVNMTGSGAVKYSGNPTVNQHIAGSGRLLKK